MNCIIHSDITDHFPVFSQFLTNCSNQKQTYVHERYFSQVNIDNFINKVGNNDWEQILNNHIPDEAFEIFSKLYNDSFQQCFPLKKVKASNKYNRSPNITTGLKTSIREKHRTEKLAAKWPLMYKFRYKTYRNKLVSILRYAKNRYFQNELKSSQGDAKATWNIINHLMGKKNKNTNEIKFENQSNLAATIFNDHFLNMINTQPPHVNIQDVSHKEFLYNVSDCSVYFYPVTTDEIQNYLKSLENTTAR